MGLNRAEQMLSDYVQAHRDERQFWQSKVQSAHRRAADEHDLAHRLEVEIWAYYRERASVVRELRETAGREGIVRISMRGLAEYWIRLWTTPKPKPPQALPPDSLPFE